MAKKADNTEVSAAAPVEPAAVEPQAGVKTEPEVQIPAEGTAEETPAEPEAAEPEAEVKTEPEVQIPAEGTTEETTVEPAVEEQQMKIVVLKRFRDKFNHKTWYEVGDEVSFDRERVNDIVERGLAKVKIEIEFN